MNFKNIRFAVRDNTNIYKLELAKSLLYFTEFDFTYFWEQCIEAGKTARKTGRLPQNHVTTAKSIISKAHPYIESLIASDFSEIVTDCIIEYICMSDRITSDELWTRCISSKNPYENAIFKRISEYKANRAINQWNNIVRIKEYASNKLAFIYDHDENGSSLKRESIRARRDYFDLTASVSANELRLPCGRLPSATFCNAASLPNSTFVISKVSKAVYKRFSDVFASVPDESLPENRDYTYTKDKLAMDAYGYVKGMPRPTDIEMKFALEAFLETPEEVYLPDSFKAVIDLEFNLMLKEDITIRRCKSCSRYFAADTDSIYCDRVNSSGKTCRRLHEESLKEITPNPAEATLSGAENPDSAYGAFSQAYVPPWRLVPPPNKGVSVPAEMEKQGQKLYNTLYKRLGKGMSENDFKEWSQYLSHMKRNVKTGDATVGQLAEFLSYSEELAEAVKAAGKIYKTAENLTSNTSQYIQESFDDTMNRPVASVIKANETHEMTSAGIDFKAEDFTGEALPENTAEPAAEKIKPFTPESFASLSDAMLRERSEKDAGVSSVPVNKKYIEIKEPNWKRMTREEAYAMQERDLNADSDDEE